MILEAHCRKPPQTVRKPSGPPVGLLPPAARALRKAASCSSTSLSAVVRWRSASRRAMKSVDSLRPAAMQAPRAPPPRAPPPPLPRSSPQGHSRSPSPDSAPSPAPQASPPSHSRLGCALRVALAPLGRRHPPCPKHRAGNPKPGVHAACTGFCGQCRARLSRTQLRSLKGLARFRMCCALTLQHALDGRELREYGARLLVHVAENER